MVMDANQLAEIMTGVIKFHPTWIIEMSRGIITLLSCIYIFQYVRYWRFYAGPLTWRFYITVIGHSLVASYFLLLLILPDATELYAWRYLFLNIMLIFAYVSNLISLGQLVDVFRRVRKKVICEIRHGDLEV